MATGNKSLSSSNSPTDSRTHLEETSIQPRNTKCPTSEQKQPENSIEALEVTYLRQGDLLSTRSFSPASKSCCRGSKCIKCCSMLAFSWGILTSHLGLFIILLLYTLGGAWMMLVIEGTEQKPFVPGIINRTGVVPAEYFTQWFVARTMRRHTDLWADSWNEDNERGRIHKNDPSLDNDNGTVHDGIIAEDVVVSIILASQNSSLQLMMNATQLRDILNSFSKEQAENDRTDDIQDRTFWEWMLFCLTIYTTIGYGSVFPVTKTGRVATMIYATIGLPLFLLTMAKMGKLLTRAVKLIWYYIHKCFYLKHVRIIRKHLGEKHRRKNKKGKNTTATKPVGSCGDGEDVMEKPEGSLQENLTTNDTADKKIEDAISYVSYKIDDEFNLNPLVAILITLVYIFLGSWMYSTWEEDWSFYDAFYFIFISITTIGLGDIVPKNPIFFLLSSIYVLIGLSLVAMVVHVLTDFYTATIHIVENRIHIRRGYKEATISTLLDDAQVQQISDEIPEIRIHALETDNEDSE